MQTLSRKMGAKMRVHTRTINPALSVRSVAMGTVKPKTAAAPAAKSKPAALDLKPKAAARPGAKVPGRGAAKKPTKTRK
jgi:hypothetical protein